MSRSSVYFRAGMLLIVVGTVFSLPNVLAVAGVVPELGDTWRSPIGVALGVLAVGGGAGLVGFALRLQRRERASRRANGRRRKK